MNRKAITSLKLPALLLVLIFAAVVPAQKEAQLWTEWSKRDAEKILNDSPWARTQVETDLSEMFYSPTAAGGNAPNARSRIEQGATNQEISVRFHIRFFSARPVRQALIRMIELNQGTIDTETAERMHSFAELVPRESIIVTVTYEASDKRSDGKLLQLFASANTGKFKNIAYLERHDGKRLFLQEYGPPGKDGFGARFIFQRFDDGVPFITADAGEIRFFCEINKDLKLNTKFRVADMVYDGKLEY